MEIIRSLDFSEFRLDSGLVIALGSFDGLHLGHQAVINRALQIATDLELPGGVYTFDPHPLEVLNPGQAPPSLLSDGQKRDILENMGVEYYFEQVFTREFSRLDYLSFVRDYLCQRLNVVHLVIGEDFHLGHQGRGSVKTLTSLGTRLGFDVTGLKTIKVRGRRVSSTLVRRLVEQGRINLIPDYLGRFFQIEGRVVSGEGRGRELGIPTANLELAADYALPPRGVYACYVHYQQEKYQGIINFGVKPTFSGRDYTVEVHIMDFSDQDLYGQSLNVELVEFIRKEMTFNSSAALVEQIEKDILYTESLLCYNKK